MTGLLVGGLFAVLASAAIAIVLIRLVRRERRGADPYRPLQR
jgi:hypothetical protein